MDTERYRLYVDLSASQVRKRLKGYGLGVRKVESVDRNRAVVIHTATGEHLRRLEALLADVTGRQPPPAFSRNESSPQSET